MITKPRRKQAIALSILTLFAAPTLATSGFAQDRLAVFDEIATIVEEQFFDPLMNGLDWQALGAQHRARITADMDRESFAHEVNTMLGQLETSHTQLVTQDSPDWYQLAGIFLPGNDQMQEQLSPYLTDGAPVYSGIGIMLEESPEGQFVIGVLDGHPAEAAGILVGDRMLSVEGEPFHRFNSFAGRAGRLTTTTIERSLGDEPGSSERRTFNVTPVLLDGRTMFEDAMRASAQIIPYGEADLGYIRIWSYAGSAYQDILTSTLLYGALREADALILDIRGGWGGANPVYLNLFAEHRMMFTSFPRDASPISFGSAWVNPVVLLADEGSRSGKELLAYGFRALDIGPVVGERTAGAVVSGRLNVLSDGSLLYVAVADIRVGEDRLEGRGVAPDIEVPFDPAYAGGADPQLDRAIDAAADLIGEVADWNQQAN